MDLLWMGWTEDAVRDLGRMEMPYQRVDEVPIHSGTYEEYLGRIEEPHLRLLYQRYFWGVFGALTRLQEGIRRHLLLFVGPGVGEGDANTYIADCGGAFLQHRVAAQDYAGGQHRLAGDVLLPRQPRYGGGGPAYDYGASGGSRTSTVMLLSAG